MQNADEKLKTVTPLSLSDLANCYGMSVYTIKRWLNRHREKIGERDGRYYNTLQVAIIYECIGPPPEN